VVVVNHHLFFADLNVRESGVAELLPTVRSVVFDEAHQLSEIGVQFLGQQFSTGQLANFSTELFKASQQHARGFAPWDELVHDLQRAGQAMHAAGGGRAGRRRWRDAAPEGMAPAEWEAVVCLLRDALVGAQKALAVVAEVSPELGTLHDRVLNLIGSVELFSMPVEPGYVRWMDTGNQIRLVHSPLDIAATMQARVLNQDAAAGRKSWIFTSATLGHDASLGWFLQSCGLEGARVLQVPSPFDYPSQAALYIPDDMPKPGDMTHTRAVAQLVAEGASVLGGRTMVLTTTLRAMRGIGEELREIFGLAGRVDVLVQGEASKRELVDRFCHAERAGGAACVLVASASFWEGIDIPGAALQLVVIDKLPFAPPDDPLVQARADQLEASGRNPFRDLHVPQAAVALKQGAGRLIRRENDRGVLVVCDVRLRQMGYAKKLLAALPPMRRLDTKTQWLEALQALTRPSTTDLQLTSNP
jgi:ATP-dependent DNA helicase DinG